MAQGGVGGGDPAELEVAALDHLDEEGRADLFLVSKTWLSGALAPVAGVASH